jgi:transcriptional regulator with XRE-family HTH domain
MMLDLPMLGVELRRRRRALRIPSAEFARRIGVSQTYVWLIEAAKPRSSGEPSRPSEDLLQRWTSALGMNETESRRIRELAGYFDVAAVDERRYTRSIPPPMASSPRSVNEFNTVESDTVDELPSSGTAPHMVALRRWARAADPDGGEVAIIDRIHEILAVAGSNQRTDEATYLLDSFLQWLAFHIGAEE